MERIKTVEAYSVEEVDKKVNYEMEQLTKQGNKIFATQTHVTSEKIEQSVRFRYTYVLFYKKVITADDIIKKETSDKPVITPDSDKWCYCQKCNKSWKYSHFKTCRCGNEIPPDAVKDRFKEIWG